MIASEISNSGKSDGESFILFYFLGNQTEALRN